jgi:plasmid stabilization system protein ParE
MTSDAATYLASLADPECRARLVETLRHAATLLDGSSRFEPEVAEQLAVRLRGAARELCDHPGLDPVSCRYCDSEVPRGP